MSTTTLGAGARSRAMSDAHTAALEKLFRRIGQLSSLPGVAQRIIEVADNEDSTAEDLLKVVEQDPTLAVRIMRTVNSSFFGLPQEVGDLQTAVSMLGFVEVRNLALTVCVARLCEESSSYGSFSREGLWKHMVAVGEIARMVSKECGCGKPEEAYMAGLLHDIGLVLIDQYMHPQLCIVIDMINEGSSLSEAEQSVLTFDHTDLGAYVARTSNFPERIVAAVEFHHAPELFEGNDSQLLEIVQIANHLASVNGVTSLGMDTSPAIPDAVRRSVGFGEEQQEAIAERVAETLEGANVLSGI
ncbi:MAG: HDOD domain-containing protein [Planctomycetota bacterium]